MTKTELEELIDGVAASMVYGLSLMQNAQGDGGEARMVASVATTGIAFEGPVPGKGVGMGGAEIHSVFSKPANLEIVRGNYVFVLRSGLVRLAYEATYHYARSNGQLALMKTEPWFYYCRTIRNVISHREHSVLDRWPEDLTKTGVSTMSWRHRTLTTAEVGKDVEITLYDCWQMYLDIRDFVQGRLT
jgi:hypothetical protein